MLQYVARVREHRRAFHQTPGSETFHRVLVIAALVAWCVLFVLAHQAGAQTAPVAPVAPVTPVTLPQLPSLPELPQPVAVTTPGVAGTNTSGSGSSTSSGSSSNTSSDGSTGINVSVDGQGKSSNAVLIMIGITLLSLAPSIVLTMSSFTRFVIVLSLTRNALGLPAIPPNQVLIGLALFLSLFVMAPTLSKINETAIQPLFAGEISQSEAMSNAAIPVKDFMLANTRRAELNMMMSMSGSSKPETPQDVPFTSLVPAFVLSELKTAFIIGFAIFVPFIVIDLVVSSVLMALGMMMLPPAFVSLPFKLLLFVLVDGWSLVVESTLRSFR